MAKSQARRRAKQLKRRTAKKTPANAQPPLTQHADISTALELQRAGKLSQAKLLYCRILERNPRNADAWHLLGMTLFAAGELAEALNSLQQANAIVPNHPDVLANMGVVYRRLGDLKQAKDVLENAVSVNPRSLAARNNLGTVLLELSELEAAAAQFEAVLDVEPQFASAALNLGNVWQQQGRLRDAESLYRRVLQRQPHNAMALNNLGETLRRQGKCAEAAEILTVALKHSPESVETRLNLGRTLVALRRHKEAHAHFLRLIQQHPEHAKPYHYLGKAQFDAGDLKNAAVNMERAITMDASDVHARCSLGFTFLQMGKPDTAVNCFRDALRIEPTMWQAHSALLFVMSGDLKIGQQELFEEHQRWGATHGRVEPISATSLAGRLDRRLRVGYVSPDFRQHAVAAFFLPILDCHRSEQVETFCYAEVPVPDEMTECLQAKSDHWRFTNGLSDLQVAQIVASDKIDVLVDLAGHTTGNRLKSFAYRPAPVQVTWLGYPNTTGLAAMDYRLTCETQNPLDEPTYHTEELVRLPAGAICFSPPSHAPDIMPLPRTEKGHVTFGSLHRPFKITPPVRELWAEVLRASPRSRFILFNTHFTDESAAVISGDLLSRGIEPERFEIRNAYEGSSYLEAYEDIDIGLDTTPWAGGTTTMEALWMGVPVVGLYGERRSARSTAAILKQVGLEDLIGRSFRQYVQLVTDLASDISRLEYSRYNLRSTLKETICNAPRFTAQLELAYRDMWRRQCERPERLPDQQRRSHQQPVASIFRM